MDFYTPNGLRTDYTTNQRNTPVSGREARLSTQNVPRIGGGNGFALDEKQNCTLHVDLNIHNNILLTLAQSPSSQKMAHRIVVTWGRRYHIQSGHEPERPALHRCKYLAREALPESNGEA